MYSLDWLMLLMMRGTGELQTTISLSLVSELELTKFICSLIKATRSAWQS
jgi:hypothetical protein